MQEMLENRLTVQDKPGPHEQLSQTQGRAETFGGAGAQNIKGAHETRL